ncbi:MAG: hypothetical protein LKF39_06765 [Lactococcus raffinolactis]|jgi:hypothetical protein|nr:hypothetical protein [Lactococcus raffinolactis]
MTIKNYTFFSPSGTEFPVSATADRRLYLMLGGMDYSAFKMQHWTAPTNTGLNRIYTDTSFVLAGAYFELKAHTLTLNANTTNFVHVNIDLSNLTSPVFMTVEAQDNSNNTDINSKSGIIKRCVEVVITNGISVVSTTQKAQKVALDALEVNAITQPIESTIIDLGWGMSVTLTKKNGMIFANGTTTPSSNAGGTGGFNIGVKVPEGFRPRLNNEAIIKVQGNNNQWGSYLVAADGNVRIVSGGMNVGYTFHVSGAWVTE